MALDTDPLSGKLLAWFGLNRRGLPWREDRTPYRVWISEIMLQQTRVDTIIAYYQKWLEAFPTIADLAAAGEQDVLKRWEGLGYYSRARSLHRAARIVVRDYGGELPSDPDVLAKLPGIGPYTAGSISSIAFGNPVPAIDARPVADIDHARPASSQLVLGHRILYGFGIGRGQTAISSPPYYGFRETSRRSWDTV